MQDPDAALPDSIAAVDLGSNSFHLVELRFPEGWLEVQPLTRADLQEEQTFLRGAGVKLEFR